MKHIETPLTTKELRFLAELLDQASMAVSRQSYEDMSHTAYTTFDETEKDAVSEAYHEWNGDFEEYEPGFFSVQASPYMSYYAAKLRRLAEKNDP